MKLATHPSLVSWLRMRVVLPSNRSQPFRNILVSLRYITSAVEISKSPLRAAQAS